MEVMSCGKRVLCGVASIHNLIDYWTFAIKCNKISFKSRKAMDVIGKKI